MKIKVKDNPDLIRDTESNAIINVNSDIISASKLRKMKSRQQATQLENLKNEVAELKELLLLTINKLNEDKT